MVGVMPFWAVLDTSVLYPMRLADTLLWIADEGIYQPLWSGDILDELRRNLSADHPNANVGRRIERMLSAFPEAAVENYSQLEPALTNDPKDRHVLAAAIVGRAQVIVTNNLRHFPPESCAPYGIQAQNFGEFVSNCFGFDPGRTLKALSRLVHSKVNPPLSLEELLDRLRADAGGFVDEVHDYLSHTTVTPKPGFLGPGSDG